MNRILIVLLALFIATTAGAQTVSTAGPGNNLGVADSPLSEFVIPATQTLSITLDTATRVPFTVPGGATCLWIMASGPVNIGNASVTSGLNGGVQIPTGTYLKLPLRMDSRTTTIYAINYTAAATAAIRLMYSK